MRMACAHPRLCSVCSRVLFGLNLCTPAVAARAAPAAAGALRQWGHGAPRWTTSSRSFKWCAAAGTARISAPFAPSCCCLLTASGRSVLAGTSTRAAATADCVAPTALVLGVVAAAIAADADLSGARGGRLWHVRAACKNEYLHVRAGTRAAVSAAWCRRCCRPAARTSSPRRPRLTAALLPRRRGSQGHCSAATSRLSSRPRRLHGRP